MDNILKVLTYVTIGVIRDGQENRLKWVKIAESETGSSFQSTKSVNILVIYT